MARVLLKANTKICVFNCDLEVSLEAADLMFKGNLFQSFGPAIAKPLSSLLLHLEPGQTISRSSHDLRVLVGVYEHVSEKYEGARPFWDLKTSNTILHWS